MTRQSAKTIVLILLKARLKGRHYFASDLHIGMARVNAELSPVLAARYAQLADEAMVKALRSILDLPGITGIVRVHDEILIETEHEPSKVEIRAICTQHGLEVKPPAASLVVSG